MSLLSRLFGRGGGKAAASPAPASTLEHKGHTIRATPFEERGRWQVCGSIVWAIDGAAREEPFIRADSASSREDAVELTLFKGRQIIDQRE